MSDDQFRENLKESSSWKKALDILFDDMNNLLVEAAGLPPQLPENNEMKEKVKEAENKVDEAVKELKKVDKKRGLYTLSSNKILWSSLSLVEKLATIFRVYRKV